ncbi:unnamed protein product [Cyprideis torosa]|uniref:Uncharacterized protein n=1 Tax=Cyprideis torosa TaxID=163714 RepID=A0A7R8ZR60_9CRUS|nr:unnamed protein product [Cyprideis torosa]CAG0898111.1 unnamed protein product [Cyprideis torosa]
MAAHLDFPLVSFFQAEKERSARGTDFVGSLQGLHSDFAWPLPIVVHPISHYRLDSTYDPDESHSLSSPRSGRKGSQSTYKSIQKDAVPHSPSNDSFDFETPSPAPLMVDTALAQSVKPGPSDRIPNEDPFDTG